MTGLCQVLVSLGLVLNDYRLSRLECLDQNIVCFLQLYVASITNNLYPQTSDGNIIKIINIELINIELWYIEHVKIRQLLQRVKKHLTTNTM